MKIFIDSANVAVLKQMDNIGILAGITTNPVIFNKELGSREEIIKNLYRIFTDYPVYIQVSGNDVYAIVAEAQKYAALAPNVSIQIPADATGIAAISQIKKRNLFPNTVCATTVLTAAQALYCAAAGADQVACYIGDIDGIGYAGMDVLADIADVLADTDTTVLAAGCERSQDMVQAAKLGADYVTITPQAAQAVLDKIAPMTVYYNEIFEEMKKQNSSRK